MLEKIEIVLQAEKPSRVLIYGDTNSTLAGALAAVKLHIPVAHVEAGLRSFNRAMPEEINRITADHLSHWLYAPTHAAVENLKREGVPDQAVELVGDVMYDAALQFCRADDFALLARLGLTSKSYILATIHRAENTDNLDRLAVIAEALRVTAEAVPVVLPIHPRTRAAFARTPGLNLGPRVELMDPVGYLDMAGLERHARLVVTDSGGVQKEAFFHRVPCVTLRDETEWVELVQHGWNTLLPPTDAQTVIAGLCQALTGTPPPVPPELYGGGHAARRIAVSLARAA
jgi:UDP-GlcNAc3NAcA epimerase